MLAYVVFSFVISLLFYSYNKIVMSNCSDEMKVTSFLLLTIISLILSTLYGWRIIENGYGGIDADTYKTVYDGLSYNFLDAIKQQRYEKGYASIVWFFRATFDNYELFQFFYFLFMLFLYRFITKNITYSSISLLSYFLISFFLIISFNLSRMMLGVFLLFFVVQFLAEKKYKKAILITILSSTIQLACLWGLVIIVYYYFYSKVQSKLKFFLMFIISIIASFILVDVFKSILVFIDYGHYVDNESDSFSFGNYIYGLLIFCLYYYCLKGREINPISEVIFIIIPTMLFIIPLYSAIPIAYRFNFIYILFFAFVIPDIFKFLKGSFDYLLIRFSIALIPLVYAVGKIFNFYERDVLSAEKWVLMNEIYFW